MEKKEWKYFFDLRPVFSYFFKKKDRSKPKSFSMRMMHGMNRIAILVFLGALIYMILKRVF